MARGEASIFRVILTLWLLVATPANWAGESPGERMPTTNNDEVTRSKAWQQALATARGQALQARLAIINDYFNGFVFAEDAQIWQLEDYWATPLEFIRRGAGDCEDFAIAKYFSLVEVGVPADTLRLVYVKATSVNRAHMVLAYYPARGSEPLIIDNLDPQIRLAGARSDLVPIYSFNAEFLWVNRQRGQGNPVGKAQRLSLWQDVLQRHRQQSTREGRP